MGRTRRRGLIAAAFALAVAPAIAQEPAPFSDLAEDIERLSREELGLPPEEPPPPPPPVSPDVFGTAAVAAPRIDPRWQRVAETGADNPAITRIVDGLAGLDRYGQAGHVQAAVNRAVVYREDIELWGAGDHWATADETLARGAGDCEDIAVAKMQALRRLGFEDRDLYLSVGRDAAGRGHAVLLVRIDARFWVLDDRAERMIEADAFRGFTPVLTFGAGTSWVHGHRRAAGERALGFEPGRAGDQGRTRSEAR